MNDDVELKNDNLSHFRASMHLFQWGDRKSFPHSFILMRKYGYFWLFSTEIPFSQTISPSAFYRPLYINTTLTHKHSKSFKHVIQLKSILILVCSYLSPNTVWYSFISHLISSQHCTSHNTVAHSSRMRFQPLQMTNYLHPILLSSVSPSSEFEQKTVVYLRVFTFSSHTWLS